MLKKTVTVLLISVFFLSLFSFYSRPVFGEYADNYILYLYSASSNAKQVSANAVTYNLYGKVEGESCEIGAETSVEKILDDFDAKTVSVSSSGGITNYYAYSKKIKYKTYINNKKINLHIAVEDSRITLGTPIIFGSF